MALTSPKKEELSKIFSKFDKNNDGKISCEELTDILKALGSNTSSEEVKKVMSEVDKDGDGFIDMHEFAAFYCGGSNDDDDGSTTKAMKELKDAFDMYDLDKNGVISAKELHAVLKRLGENCSLIDCSRMINKVDVDGDGHVNFEEFKKMMTKS